MYGSVTSKDIAQELERVLGKPFDKRKLELPEPIRTLGAFPVTVRLHPGLTVVITVTVVSSPAIKKFDCFHTSTICVLEQIQQTTFIHAGLSAV